MTHLHALLLTLAIEGLVGGALLGVWPRLRGASLVRGMLVVLAASLLTHPAAWQANRVWLVELPFITRAPIIELSVAAAEAVILGIGLRSRASEPERARVGWGRCLVISVAMNAASFGYGLWLLR